MGLLSDVRKPWLRRDFSEKRFDLRLTYLLNRLDPRDKKKVDMKEGARKSAWQQKKVDAVLRSKSKMRTPIRLVLHENKERFRIDDGVSRLIAHRQNGSKRMKARIRVADW